MDTQLPNINLDLSTLGLMTDATGFLCEGPPANEHHPVNFAPFSQLLEELVSSGEHFVDFRGGSC